MICSVFPLYLIGDLRGKRGIFNLPGTSFFFYFYLHLHTLIVPCFCLLFQSLFALFLFFAFFLFPYSRLVISYCMDMWDYFSYFIDNSPIWNLILEPRIFGLCPEEVFLAIFDYYPSFWHFLFIYIIFVHISLWVGAGFARIFLPKKAIKNLFFSFFSFII